MGKDCIQLEMNFNGSSGNSFGAHLKSGEFQMLVELPLPGADAKVADTASKYADYEYLVLKSKIPAALAFTDEHALRAGT